MAAKFKAASCPFCGTVDNDVDIVFNEFSDDEGSVIQIGCVQCGATGPMVRGPLIGRCTAEQDAQALALWNERSE